MAQYRLSLTFSVELLVGSGKKSFIVNPHILTSRSVYFEAALSSSCKASGQPLELPRHDPETFHLYLRCASESKDFTDIDRKFHDESCDVTSLVVKSHSSDECLKHTAWRTISETSSRAT